MPAQPPLSFSDLLEQRLRGDAREAHVRLRPIGNPSFQVLIKDEDLKPRRSLDELYDGAGPGDEVGGQPAPPTTTSSDDIARELGLPGLRTGEAIARTRRRFALLNHPDRLDPALRETANRRMMIANQLLDEALSRLS